MSKGLEALEKLNHTICLNLNNKTLQFNLDKYEACDCKDIREFCDCYEVIEKELKALEVIKKKNVSFGIIVNTKNVSQYNNFLYETFMCYKDLGSNNLTQEEYDLLKEVLL